SGRRVFAFTVDAHVLYTDLAYEPGDVLLFGPESVGLPDEVQHHPWVSERVRIPMVAGVRSLNLSNAAAIAVYEAWRQQGFAGSSRRRAGGEGPSSEDGAGAIRELPRSRRRPARLTARRGGAWPIRSGAGRRSRPRGSRGRAPRPGCGPAATPAGRRVSPERGRAGGRGRDAPRNGRAVRPRRSRRVA